MAISHLVKELTINYDEVFSERSRLLNFSNNKAKEDELEKGIERVKKDPEKLETDDKETSGIFGAIKKAIGIIVKLIKKMISFIILTMKAIAKYAKKLLNLGKSMRNSCWKGSLKKTAKRTKKISGKLKSFKGKGAIIAGIVAVIGGLVYSIISNKKPGEELEEEKKEEESTSSPETPSAEQSSPSVEMPSPAPVASAPAASPAPASTPTEAPKAASAAGTPVPAAPQAASGSKQGEPVEAQDPKAQSEKQIKGAGIKVRPTGDVWQGGPLSKTAVSVALSIQNQVKGFQFYTGLNDAFHKKTYPNSQHAIGQGLDFVLDHMPSVKESQAIKEQIKLIPGVLPPQVKNEYYNPPEGNKTAATTGPHMHVGVVDTASALASPDKKIEKTIIVSIENNKTQNNIIKKAA